MSLQRTHHQLHTTEEFLEHPCLLLCTLLWLSSLLKRRPSQIPIGLNIIHKEGLVQSQVKKDYKNKYSQIIKRLRYAVGKHLDGLLEDLWWHLPNTTCCMHVRGVQAEVAKVMEVHKFKNEGRYGKIRKVCISRMTNISTIVGFARKKSKALRRIN